MRPEAQEANSVALPASEPASQGTSTLARHAYSHLCAANVFKGLTMKFNRESRRIESIADSHERILASIEHSKSFLTYLDRKKGMEERMPFELFAEDYFADTERLAKEILLRQ